LLHGVTSRIKLLGVGAAEWWRHGVPVVVGSLDREILIVVGGVGGFQLAPLLARRALRERDEPIGTVAYRWQFGVPGEIWTDLMWYRRNRVMAARLARIIANLRRQHRSARIHILAFSGGAGIAAFACERLSDRGLLGTLILAAPALSPTYDLGPALRAVERCYALSSPRDRWVLGVGTRSFGTMDRRRVASAGMRGFRIPSGLPSRDTDAYDRCREVVWTPGLRAEGHHGGHVGWLAGGFLRRHLVDLIRGRPSLPTRPVTDGQGAPDSA